MKSERINISQVILILLFVAILTPLQVYGNGVNSLSESDNTNENLEFESYAHLSMQLVKAVRDGEPFDHITRALAEVSPEELRADLSTPAKDKAFWLNIYNAYVQILLLDEPELFEDRNSWFGYNFFTSPQVTIAGKELSFDDIEHGIMRRSKVKISLGYLNQWFVDDFIRKFWWDEVDARIHFAVNCGAASCPYIAPFDPDRAEEQLEIAKEQYLTEHTDYYPDENRVEVTRLISWFRGDFGGIYGAIDMIKELGIIPEDANPSVDFKHYDWTLELGNYQEL